MNKHLEVFKAVPNYEHELTELKQRNKICAETGEFVRKRDYDYAITQLEKPRLGGSELEELDKEKVTKALKDIFIKGMSAPNILDETFEEDLAKAICQKFGTCSEATKVSVEEMERLIDVKRYNKVITNRNFAQAIHDLIYKGDL